MNLDFGALLGRAWKITWNHKVLWAFGILAALGGGGGNPNFSFDQSNFPGGSGGPGDLPADFQRFFNRFFEGFDPTLAIGIGVALLCVLALLAVVFLVLSVIGRGGLIGGVQMVETAGTVTFSQAWQAGLSSFWRLVVIQLVVAVVAVVVTAISFVAAATLCLLPLACVGFLLVILLGIIAYFAQIAAVLENLQLTDAVQRAWALIRANIGPIIILGILLAVISSVAGFVMALPLVAAAIPAFLSLVGYASERPFLGNTGLIITLVCGAAYLPVLIVLSGVLQTWITSVWVLAYQQFTRPAASAPVPAA